MPELDDSEPQYSDDALVCRCSSFRGNKVVAVIVDQAAGVIHFQNCFRRNWSLGIRAQAWCSCPLAELCHARHLCRKGFCSLTITTTAGSAVIASCASQYDDLRKTLDGLIPPIDGILQNGDDVLGLSCFGAFAGMFAGVALCWWLQPRNGSGVYELAFIGGGFLGAAFAALFGNWILRQKYRR